MNNKTFYEELLKYYYPTYQIENLLKTASTRIKYLDRYIKRRLKKSNFDYDVLFDRILQKCHYMPTIVDVKNIFNDYDVEILDKKIMEKIDEL